MGVGIFLVSWYSRDIDDSPVELHISEVGGMLLRIIRKKLHRMLYVNDEESLFRQLRLKTKRLSCLLFLAWKVV